MKKLLSFTLAVLMLFLAPSVTAINEVYSGKCGDNLYWSFTYASNKLVITGDGDMYDYSNPSDAPWYEFRRTIGEISLPDGLTHIGDNAFYYFLFAYKCDIPDSVTSIGNKAFIHCDALEDVVLPSSLESIGCSAFSNCKSIQKITLPPSLSIVSEKAFENCVSLTEVIFSDGISKIESSAFAGIGIEELVLPESVTSIGPSAFIGCSSLSRVSVTNNITFVGALAFKDTAWYNDTEPGCIYVGSTLYRYKSGTDEDSVSVRAGTVSISPDAFALCSNLKSVDIPDSVTSIGSMAFRDCPNLLSLSLPSSVSNIGDWALGYRLDYTVSSHPLKQEGFSFSGSSRAAFEYSEKNSITYTCCHSLIAEENFVSCAEGGTIVSHCKYCDYRGQTGIIPPGHKSNQKWKITVRPTETEPGTAESKCTVCGETAALTFDYFKIGDVNGDGKVNNLDFIFLKRTLLRLRNVKDLDLIRCDINLDNKISSMDVILMKRILLKKVKIQF